MVTNSYLDTFVHHLGEYARGMQPRQFEARDATRKCRHCSLTSAYWGKTGKHLLVLSFTGFDRVEIPQRSSLLHPTEGVLTFRSEARGDIGP